MACRDGSFIHKHNNLDWYAASFDQSSNIWTPAVVVGFRIAHETGPSSEYERVCLLLFLLYAIVIRAPFSLIRTSISEQRMGPILAVSV